MHYFSGMKCKGTMCTMYPSENFLTFDPGNTSLNKVLLRQ